jgi:hypothetical protein
VRCDLLDAPLQCSTNLYNGLYCSLYCTVLCSNVDLKRNESYKRQVEKNSRRRRRFAVTRHVTRKCRNVYLKN